MTNEIEHYLNLAMSSPFPYKSFSNEELIKDYKKLLHTRKVNSIAGLNIIENYHKSIWHCNRYGYKSPIEAWQDPNIMSYVIQNRLKYMATKELSALAIRTGLYVSGRAPKVSIFKPALAKYLINKYLQKYDTIFDPCCGFSGRLLGTATLNKKYIGYDINSITVRESNQLINALNIGNSEVLLKNSLYEMGTFDCLFTCPPYGNKEHWHQDIEELSADEWIDTCLKNYKCEKYLFVIDKTEKYKDYIVETLENKSHFGCNTEQVIFISSK